MNTNPAMRTALLLLLFGWSVAESVAQGKVQFSTYSFAPVTNLITGQLVPTGTDWWAQLYYGRYDVPDDRLLISATNAPVHLTITGFVHINVTAYYTDPAVIPGGAWGTFQVRVWEAVLGNSWDVAFANWQSDDPMYSGKALGKSNLALITTCDANAVPPCNPARLNQTYGGQIPIQAFNVGPIPEPTMLALGLMGILALRCYRRRI